MGVSGAPGIFSSLRAFREPRRLGLKFTAFSQFIGGFSLPTGACTDSWPLAKYGTGPRLGMNFRRAIRLDACGRPVSDGPRSFGAIHKIDSMLAPEELPIGEARFFIRTADNAALLKRKRTFFLDTVSTDLPHSAVMPIPYLEKVMHGWSSPDNARPVQRVIM